MRLTLLMLVSVLTLSLRSSATLRSPVTEVRSHGRHVATGYLAQPAGQAPGTGSPLSVAVDGAVSPELIPDELAYSHFLRAMAASGLSGRARQAALTQTGLEPNDRKAFVAALGILGPELDAIAQQRQAGGRGLSAVAAEQLRTREDQAIADARLRIGQALSAAGLAPLDAYIHTHVTRHIRIYRGPMMGAGGHH